jgi:hypothetical protein
VRNESVACRLCIKPNLTNQFSIDFIKPRASSGVGDERRAVSNHAADSWRFAASPTVARCPTFVVNSLQFSAPLC